MTKKTWEDFLVAFSKANKFVFPNTTAMQQAAEEMWNDLKEWVWLFGLTCVLEPITESIFRSFWSIWLFQ